MRFKYYKLTLITVAIISILIIVTPIFSEVLVLPMGEQFSELYILGPNRLFEDYPFNITVGQTYSLYVGVANHLTSSNYYLVYVKFRNQMDHLPNATTGTPSPLQPLYEYRFFLQKDAIWEAPLNFSILDATLTKKQTIIKKLEINGVAFDVDKPSTWDESKQRFYYQIFLELWIYNIQSNSILFNNRCVSLQLNLTGTA